MRAGGPAKPGEQERPNGPDSGAPPTGGAGAGVFLSRRGGPRFPTNGADGVAVSVWRGAAHGVGAARRANQPERGFSERRSGGVVFPTKRFNRQPPASELGRRSRAARRAAFPSPQRSGFFFSPARRARGFLPPGGLPGEVERPGVHRHMPSGVLSFPVELIGWCPVPPA